MNILIVEDSPLEMKRICRMVREAVSEVQIFSFTDSIEAMNQIVEHRFYLHVAFLDIEMPSPNGIELAELLAVEYPKINVIFTTAYASYMQQAFGMFVSGYLLKPFSTKDISKQLENLRYPLEKEQLEFFAKTKGEFDFFYQGKPVSFSLNRSKEALAYLISCQGASVTKRELFSILFEDAEYTQSKQDYMKKIMRALQETLEKVNGEGILLHTRNSYAVDIKKIMTDLPEVGKRKGGIYMAQYSWAEGWH